MSHPFGEPSSIDAESIEEGRVLRLVLNAPKGNVLTMRMMGELREALATHRDRRTLKMVLVRGAGGTFSLGASVAEHRRDQAPAMLAAFSDLVRDVATYPVPIAALVEGRCLGGAFELVLACHLVFATPSAVMGCPEVKLGVVPPVLSAIGHLRMGGVLSERLLITGTDLDAQTAERLGLLSAVVSEAEAERQVLRWYRETIAPLSAFTLREATHAARQASGLIEALRGPLQAAERRYLERLLPSHDGNEGIQAFLEKRPPQWSDS